VSQDSDVKLIVRDLLRAEWDATRATVDPNIRTGWHNNNHEVQVTVSNDEESARSETGRSNLSGGSARRGTIQVNTWADKRAVDAGTDGAAKKAAYAARDEVDEILRNHGADIYAYNFDTATTAETYRYLSFMGATYMPEEPDEEQEPVRHRYLVTVGYEYLRE
jgi:hypothetical protein